MIWLVGVVLAVVALVLFGVLALRLYRSVRLLGRVVGAASETIGDASTGLAVTPPPGRTSTPGG